jgi:serine/threonine-protein kinase
VETGTTIGPYKIIRHLGSGGMGAVWLAEDPRLHRQVALKMVRPADSTDESSRARLMREARAAAALNHPHIATVHDVLEDRGEVVIVFEYVEGETLHARIARGPLPPPEAVNVATQIAKALAAAHAQGVVHRDLKPANVIIGAGGHVKVLDFGIARILAVGTTETSGPLAHSSSGGFIGTPSYAAPEQMVSSAVDERADLYALGVVLFEMISGRRPFPGNDPVQLATSKLSEDAPPLSSTGHLVPPMLDRLVARLLARDPGERPLSAADVVTQLGDIYSKRGAPGLWPSMAAVAAIAALAGFGAWEIGRFVRPPIDPSAPPVIAVMPLANVSGDPAKDYVAAGIAESLISSLAALPSVTVLSRASVTEARLRAKDEAALAKDLGATYVVNGSVQEANGTLKISLNLVKPDRTVAWGDSVEGAFDRIFDLQSRLANALTTALVVRVSAIDREKMNAQPTASPQALSAYWQGRALMDRLDVAGNVDAAIASFQEATQLDPRFAFAHASLGRAYWEKYVQTRDAEWTTKALDAGAGALRLNASLPEVRLSMATILSGTGRHAEAIQELSQALAVRPNYDDARRQLAMVLARLGRIDEAIAEYRRAIALRPTAWLTYSSMGLALFNAARYDDAISAFTKVTELQPDNVVGYQQLGTVYQTVGNIDLARENYRRAVSIRPAAQTYSNLGTLEYAGGDYSAAVDAYRSAIKLRPNAAATHRNLGDALAKLGRSADARLAYLEAVRLAEADHKVNPKDARTIAAIGVYNAKAGRIAIARERIGDALTAAKDDVDVLFRAAVVEAVAGNHERAFIYLEQAAARGYSRSTMASADEFEALRGSERFEKLIQPAGKPGERK